jgi:hypothetical protein
MNYMWVCNNNNNVGHCTHTSERANAGTRNRGTINNKDRIAATMYPLGTWFVSGICVWIPCIKETMMIIVILCIQMKERSKKE